MELKIEVQTVSANAVRGLQAVESQAHETARAAGKIDDAMAQVGANAPRAVQPIASAFTAAGTQATSLSDRVSGLVTTIGGLWAFQQATNLVRNFTNAVVDSVLEVTRLGDELVTVSQKTGIAVDQLGELKYAAQQSEVEFGALAQGIRFLQVALVEAAGDPTGAAAEAFDRIGVSATDASGQMRSAAEILPSIAQGLQGLGTDAERTAAAVEIFGRSGTLLIPMFEGGAAGLIEMTTRARELGLALDPRTAQAASALDDELDTLSARLQVMKSEAVAPLLPVITTLSEDMVILSRATKDLDPTPAQQYGTKLVLALSPLAPILSDLVLLFGLIDKAADKAAESMKRAADEAVNTSRIGELRLQEQAAANPVEPITVRGRRPEEEISANIRVTPPDWSEVWQQAGEEAGRMEDERRREREERERAARQSAEESAAHVRGIVISAEQKAAEAAAKAHERLIGTMREHVSVTDALDSAFNDLARVAELVHNKTLAVTASIASFVIEIAKLIKAMEGGGGGGGFWDLFGVVASTAGAGGGGGGGGRGVGDGGAPIVPAAPRLDQTIVTPLVDAGRTITKAADRIYRGALDFGKSVVTFGKEGVSGVAPLSPIAGAPFGSLAGSLAGMGGAMMLGIPAVVGMGQFLGSMLSSRNEAGRRAVAEMRSQLERDMAAGTGPQLDPILRRGGYYGSDFGGFGPGDSVVPSPFEESQIPPPEEQGKGRASGSSSQITVNVKSVDTKTAREYFSSADFAEAMRYAASVRTID